MVHKLHGGFYAAVHLGHCQNITVNWHDFSLKLTHSCFEGRKQFCLKGEIEKFKTPQTTKIFTILLDICSLLLTASFKDSRATSSAAISLSSSLILPVVITSVERLISFLFDPASKSFGTVDCARGVLGADIARVHSPRMVTKSTRSKVLINFF